MPEKWSRSLEFQAKLVQWAKRRWKRAVERRKAKFRDVVPPPLKDVVALRNVLLIAIFISLCFPMINVYTHWFDFKNPCEMYQAMGMMCEYPRPWYAGLDVYGWAFASMLALFAGLIDYIIYRRGGASIVDW
jgi:hypothetical protein